MDAALEAELQLLLATDSRTLPDLPNKKDKTNWVEKAGGLPSYINRIAKHLHSEKGFTVSRAIAVAVNTVKRWCSSGEVTDKGGGGVSAKTKALACKAVAAWEAKKAASGVKASLSGNGKEKMVVFEGEYLFASDRELVVSLAADIENALHLAAGEEDAFDVEVFENALALARQDLNLDTGPVISFDPRTHPRDFRGRFRNGVKALTTNESIQLPDGTAVKATRIGGKPQYTVLDNSGKPRGTSATPFDAADKALDVSAGNEHKDALGGEGTYNNATEVEELHGVKQDVFSGIEGRLGNAPSWARSSDDNYADFVSEAIKDTLDETPAVGNYHIDHTGDSVIFPDGAEISVAYGRVRLDEPAAKAPVAPRVLAEPVEVEGVYSPGYDPEAGHGLSADTPIRGMSI